MTKRKENVIQAAVRESDLLIESLELELAKRQGPRRSDRQIKNNILIRDACLRMLMRRSPVYPSASAISEECGLLSKQPPAPRSINNRYAGMHRIWRNAFEELLSGATAPIISETGDFEGYDRSHMTGDDRRLTDDLIRANHSLRHKNNVLRQFIAENVPLRKAPEHGEDDLVDEVEHFLQTVLIAGFELDDVALRTTRRVPSGAIVMERSLFDRLQDIVDSRNKASRAANLLD